MKLLTATEAAVELNLDVTRIQVLCRQGRLGYTIPRKGWQWIITQEELDEFRRIGPLRAGRPRKRKGATDGDT